MFQSILLWSNEKLPSHKLVWVRCSGLPLSLCNKKCFEKVVLPIGMLHDVDEEIKAWTLLQYARLRV